jgi:hypothetical protein
MFPYYHHPLRNLELNTYASVLQPTPVTLDFNAFPLCQVKDKTKVGRWEQWERFAFLRGLRMYGRGKWKKISKLIPTR